MKFVYRCNEATKIAKRNVAIELACEALDRWKRARWTLRAFKHRKQTAHTLASKGLL